ncbi:MAG: outer membrane protein assembly factor BamD [Gemmatimonadetes bacterium]|nr:outer membrane protein assembly factor BamD [Gemmatimonadota bacterium]NIQ52050.1 outer membrane protein assembly factor BamD [Gemmatimonadota bacterium]NIU72147.1 outer membrane protein assembly factor BamD [Gammaproteobacteria bacterium]NIX42699.1 outer membrane protein assembly factor BamD [Gemmatimonadota bacterium]NIY06864.1 outer membrane protein assembly factor BamD [Gemmatimonadota bacterium]
MKTTGNRIAPALAVLAVLLGLGGCGPKAPPLAQLEPEQLWVRGVQEYNDEDWDDAIRYFERFILVGGTDPRVHQARYYVGEAHFRKDEYVTAATAFAQLAADLGRSDLADDARFMACRAYEELSPDPQLDQEYTRAALDHCSSLVEYFGDSEYAERARAIVDEMWSKLGEKVYETGEWYRRRRAYDSALIYYEDVVDQYPATEWAPKSLLRMVEIYEVLEYEEELETTRQRLLTDYPESAEARQLAGA